MVSWNNSPYVYYLFAVITVLINLQRQPIQTFSAEIGTNRERDMGSSRRENCAVHRKGTVRRKLSQLHKSAAYQRKETVYLRYQRLLAAMLLERGNVYITYMHLISLPGSFLRTFFSSLFSSLYDNFFFFFGK